MYKTGTLVEYGFKPFINGTTIAGLGSNVVHCYDDWNSIGIEIPPSNQWNGTRTSLKEDKLREREVYYRGRHINEMDMCSDTRRSWVEKRNSPLKEKEYDDDM